VGAARVLCRVSVTRGMSGVGASSEAQRGALVTGRSYPVVVRKGSVGDFGDLGRCRRVVSRASGVIFRESGCRRRGAAAGRPEAVPLRAKEPIAMLTARRS